MIKLKHLREMAAEPKTRRKADRLAKILPSTKKEAQDATKAFWEKFLTTKFGWKEEGVRPSVMDEIIKVKQVEIQGGEKVPFLEWYAVVTFMPRKSMMMTMIITTLDEPGAYRMDLMIPGVRKTLGRAIREEATKEVMSMQDRITTTLSGEDLQAFNRLRTSMAQVKHTHKDGVRQDDNIIARVKFDEIPLQDLHERAGELKKIVKAVGEIAAKAVVADEREKKTKTKVNEAASDSMDSFREAWKQAQRSGGTKKQQLERLIDLLDDRCVEGESPQRFKGGYGDVVICTSSANALKDLLGGEIHGFFEDDNPDSEIGQLAGGHDFLVVDDRYIVDYWIKHVESISKQGVFDLQDPKDEKKVERLYGDWK